LGLLGNVHILLGDIVLIWGYAMSADLKSTLNEVIEQDYKNNKQSIETNLENYRTLILQLAKEKHLDVTIWVQGSEVEETIETAKCMNLLERGDIVTGETKYTRGKAFRHYLLTQKGKELAINLLKE
jgi:hypothetical protein